MGYEYKNKKGNTYFLKTTKSPRGTDLFFFSKSKTGKGKQIDLPKDMKIIENKKTGLPLLKRNK